MIWIELNKIQNCQFGKQNKKKVIIKSSGQFLFRITAAKLINTTGEKVVEIKMNFGHIFHQYFLTDWIDW